MATVFMRLAYYLVMSVGLCVTMSCLLLVSAFLGAALSDYALGKVLTRYDAWDAWKQVYFAKAKQKREGNK